MRPYLDSEVFAPLKDKGEFQNIHNGKYFVEWDCGAALSADSIETRWRITTEDTQQGAAPTANKGRRTQ